MMLGVIAGTCLVAVLFLGWNFTALTSIAASLKKIAER